MIFLFGNAHLEHTAVVQLEVNIVSANDLLISSKAKERILQNDKRREIGELTQSCSVCWTLGQN